jgi:hypothetical protein
MRAVLFAAIALVACKQKSEGFSCWMGNVCEDYPSDVAAHEHACKAIKGEWEKHVCPTENLVGTCITDQHQSRMYYGGAQNAYTSDTASAACEHELHGSWTSTK